MYSVRGLQCDGMLCYVAVYHLSTKLFWTSSSNICGTPLSAERHYHERNAASRLVLVVVVVVGGVQDGSIL